MKLLAKQHQESYENARICYIWKKKIEDKHAKTKTILKSQRSLLLYK